MFRQMHKAASQFAFVFLLGGLTSPLFSQMYSNQTVYTDQDSSTGTLHAWGYTYAPSGDSTVHQYSAQVNVQLTGGRWVTSTAGGSYLTPAQADAYVTITTSDPVGPISIWTSHLAFCPFFQGGMNPFLDSTTSQVGIALHAFTYQLQYVLSNGNGHYQRCNNPLGICPVIDASPSEFQQSLPQYAIFGFVTVTLLGDTSCFKVFRVRADSCVADRG